MTVEIHHTKAVVWSMLLLFVLTIGTPIGFLCYYKSKYEMSIETVHKANALYEEQKELCTKYKNIAIFHRESASYIGGMNERLVDYLYKARSLIIDYDARLKACQSVDSENEIQLVENQKESMIGGEDDE